VAGPIRAKDDGWPSGDYSHIAGSRRVAMTGRVAATDRRNASRRWGGRHLPAPRLAAARGNRRGRLARYDCGTMNLLTPRRLCPGSRERFPAEATAPVVVLRRPDYCPLAPRLWTSRSGLPVQFPAHHLRQAATVPGVARWPAVAEPELFPRARPRDLAIAPSSFFLCRPAVAALSGRCCHQCRSTGGTKLSAPRISVTLRRGGRAFAYGSKIIPKPGETGRGPWRLSDETARSLGLASSARLHRCRVCRGLFIGHYSARLCSDVCAETNHRMWVEGRGWPPKILTPEQGLAVRCQVCGRAFPAQRLSARFCSNRCRQKHYRDLRNGAA
jgi:hypothetical protein